MSKIVTAIGAFVSAALGYAALHVSGVTPSSEMGIAPLLLGLAVLVICVGSYRSGFSPKERGDEKAAMGRTFVRPEERDG
jgi:hypothetical protein